MAEEKKEREKNEDQDEQDPLADLLVEGEEEGSGTPEEPEDTESENKAKEENEEQEEPAEKGPGEEEKGQEPPEDFEDPLASILGDEEPLEESQKEDSESDAKEEKSGEEQEEDKEAEEAPSRGKLAILFWILAILVPLVLGGAGVFTLLQLMKKPVATLPKVEKKAISKAETSKKEQNIETPVVSSPIAVEERKLLFLKDFLIPYRRETGEYVFVKAKVMLYYAKKADFLRAKKNEARLREELYRLFRNVPLYLWENPKGAKVIEREFMDYLTKKKIGGVVPIEIKISGYVLK